MGIKSMFLLERERERENWMIQKRERKKCCNSVLCLCNKIRIGIGKEILVCNKNMESFGIVGVFEYML